MKEASCILHKHLHYLTQYSLTVMITLYRIKLTFPLFSETMICEVTENTCIKQMSIVNVFAPIGLTWFQPALKYGQQYNCNSFSMTLPHRGTWHHNWWPLTTRTQTTAMYKVHVPLFHERIDHLNLAQSSNTSHQHTNIQMRWLPLYDGAVPS